MTDKGVYDVVVFGATGFAGELTAKYLANKAGNDCRWALAGRDLAKLEQVRQRLVAANPACADLPLLRADTAEPDTLRELAESARVVLTTVGPYLHHGEPLVAACAEAGTDYVDLTGEPEFVDRMYAQHHEQAVRTGARIVHAGGYDCVPQDLGALFTVKQLPEGVPVDVKGLVRAGGRISGGTLHSALNSFARVRETSRAAARRRRLEPGSDRRIRTGVGTPRHDGRAGAWVVPLPTLDPQVIGRSAKALTRYGPNFRYTHYAAVKHLPIAVGGALGMAGLFALAQIPPARRALLRKLPSGEGPTAQQRAESWFRVRFVGEGGGRRVVTEVAGGDPGYDETAKMLAESALSLAFDENPATSGQVTTAQAMGEALTRRIHDAGITFRVVHVEDA